MLRPRLFYAARTRPPAATSDGTPAKRPMWQFTPPATILYVRAPRELAENHFTAYPNTYLPLSAQRSPNEP